MAERLLVVVPTYNERVNLPLVVPAILQQDPRLEVLVVDDNSPDGTGQLADELAASTSAGARAAPAGQIRTGEGIPGRVPLGAGAEVRSHLRDGRRLLARSQVPGGFRASRQRCRRRDRLPVPYRRQRDQLAHLAAAALDRRQRVRPLDHRACPLADSTGGFKCFRREVLEAIDFEKVRSNGYSFQIEMSFRAWKKGFRLVEIPIVFTDRVEGQSKMNKRIVREAIWMVWWLRLQSLIGRL